MALFIRICLLSIIFLYLSNFLVTCERIKDKMYLPLDGVFCFRRFTAFKQHGCSSSFNGDVGVVHFISSQQDVNWLVEKAAAGPYAPVVEMQDFKRVNMLALRGSGKLSGMILWNNGTPHDFSTEDSCPNRKTGLLDDQCGPGDAWNSVGNSLLFEDWNFPILYIKSTTTIDNLHKCFINHNAELEGQTERPLCAVELRSHMLGAVDTQTCIRRSNLPQKVSQGNYCDPLGDFSLYQYHRPELPIKGKSVILFLVRQDGASMFDGLAPGAMSPITSLVTAITVASHLKEMSANNNNTDKNIMFMFLNGEAFDYIGSSRVVYEMEHYNFPTSDKPLALSQIDLIVELDQLSGDNLYYHTHGNTSQVKKFVEELTSDLSDSSIQLKSSPGKLPPCSIQRFLMANQSLEHVLITNYNKSYVNQYYHSIFDNEEYLQYTYANNSGTYGDIQKKLSDISAALAKSLYSIAYAQPYSDVVEPKTQLIDELLHCYLQTQNCSIFHNITDGMPLPDSPATVYVGVDYHNNTITQLTARTLAYLSSPKLPGITTRDQCNNLTTPGFQYFWMIDVCVESSVGYFLARSPAFDIEGYDWKSNDYSSWTESVWRDFGMRMFLKPSWKHEVFNVTMGIFILILSFITVYFIKSKANVMFSDVVIEKNDKLNYGRITVGEMS